MGNLMKWYQMVTAQPHKATANGGSILIAEPKIERLAVTFAPVQSGSGTPSPSNVRPISGWTGLSVQMAGGNLINDTLRYVANSERVYIGATDDGHHIFLKAGTYIISCNFDEPYAMYWAYQQNGSSSIRLWSPGVGQRSMTFIAEADGLYKFWVYRSSTNGGVDTAKIKSVTLTTASTIIDYPITWANEVGTVYGGTVDLVSGLLAVNRAMVDLGTLDWNYAAIGNGHRFHASGTALVNKKPKVPTDLQQKMGLVCSMFDEKLPNQYNVAVNGITIYTNSTFQVYDASMSAMSATEFKAAMSGVQLVYELATPQTYQLTPQVINAPRGMQTVSSSTGSVEITYWTH